MTFEFRLFDFMGEKKSTILMWYTVTVFLSGDLGGYRIEKVCLIEYQTYLQDNTSHVRWDRGLKDIHSLFEVDVVFKVPGMNKNPHYLGNKLAKSPRGVGIFFCCCLADKNKWKKNLAPWGFSQDTPVVRTLSAHNYL